MCGCHHSSRPEGDLTPDLELECIPKLVIILSDCILGFGSVCPMCIPTFKCVYHMCIPTFSSFIVLRAQFPSPSFPCGLKAPSNGETHLCHIQPWSNGNALGCRILGRRIVPGWTATAAPLHIGRTRVRTADQKVGGCLHYHSAAAYAETNSFPHCLEPCLGCMLP